MAVSLISVFVTYDITISTYLTHANVSFFFSSLGRKLTLDCFLLNECVFLKHVLYCQGQSWASWVTQRTALQYWVCTWQKQSDQPCDYKSPACNDQRRVHPSSSVSRMIFLFSFWISALCCRCMFFFFFYICIEGEWRTGAVFPQYISGWLWKCACNTLF